MSNEHPALTPRRIAELGALAKTIDREEIEDLKALGRKVFAWRDAGRLEVSDRPRAEELEEIKSTKGKI